MLTPQSRSLLIKPRNSVNLPIALTIGLLVVISCILHFSPGFHFELKGGLDLSGDQWELYIHQEDRYAASHMPTVVRARYEKLGISILPKNMAARVPILVQMASNQEKLK